MNETPHSLDVNACEYNLDELFAKQSDSSNRGPNKNNNGSMDGQNCIPRKPRLDVIYDSRIEELSQRISLLDSTIEIYDNTDLEDGLNNEEIVENQVTRMGILIKKQSIRIKTLSKQENTCLYTEKLVKHKLLGEQEKSRLKIRIINEQLKKVQSTLDDLNFGSNKYEIERHSSIGTKTHGTSAYACFPKLTMDSESNRNKAMFNSTSCKFKNVPYVTNQFQALGGDLYGLRNSGDVARDITEDQRPDLADNLSSNGKVILTRKEILSLTFGLNDEKSSILV